MNIPSLILNVTVRVRHRRVYTLGGGVFLLLLVGVVPLYVFLMGPDRYPLWYSGSSSDTFEGSLVVRHYKQQEKDNSKSLIIFNTFSLMW